MAEPNRLRRAWVKMVALSSAEQRQREPVADTRSYPHLRRYVILCQEMRTDGLGNGEPVVYTHSWLKWLVTRPPGVFRATG
jgi:hypothetical protein